MMSGNLSTASSMTSLNADANPRCVTHKKSLKFFCCKHEILLCSVCAVKSHRKCDEVLTITEASDDKKTEGQKILDVYKQRIALVENAIVERKAARKLLDTNAQEIQNEIHHVTQRLIDLVNHEERTLIQNLHDMQTKESESLEKDIANLEITCNSVKSLHVALAQNLKLSDIDLISAVIKEKHHSDDKKNVDHVVKKRFREIDFKFVASPHITSFLKHFKTLGQVMMSDDTNDGPRRTSSVASTLNDLPPSPVSRRAFDFPQADQQSQQVQQLTSHQHTKHQPHPSGNTSDESPLSARERWARDRLKQSQMRNQNTSLYGTSSATLANPNRPVRTLPRPATPEVFNRQRVLAPKRDFTERPVSTPPMDFTMHAYNQRGIENLHTNGHRPKSTVPSTDRHSPVPSRSPTYRYNGSPSVNHDIQYETHHSHPVHVFQQREPTDYTMDVDNSLPQSPDHVQHLASPVLAIKDEDSTYGRSFAAVQVTNTNTFGNYEGRTISRLRPGNSSTSQMDRRSVTDEESDVFSSHPPSYSNAVSRRRVNNIEFDRARSPTDRHGTQATDEEKERRWINRAAFTSNGMGTKRLLCGVGVLQDGHIILVDQEHYTVQLFDQHRRFMNEVKLDSRPYDVAVLNENKIAVSLQTERTIKFFLVTGDTLTPVADLGVPCEMVCYGICRMKEGYCVCCGDEICILSDEGRVVNKIKFDKVGCSLFVQAEYVTTDISRSIIFISDAGNNKVLAMNVNGRRLWEFTYQGFKPSGITFKDQYLYICDRDQHRVLMLNIDGHVVKQSVIGRIENPRALAFNSAGNILYVTQMRYDAMVSPQRPIQVYSLQ